jgi:hypothetical protein
LRSSRARRRHAGRDDRHRRLRWRLGGAGVFIAGERVRREDGRGSGAGCLAVAGRHTAIDDDRVRRGRARCDPDTVRRFDRDACEGGRADANADCDASL